MSLEKKFDVHPVTLVKSSRHFLIKEFIDEIKGEMSPDPSKVLFESRHTDETALSEIVQEAKNLPMFHDRKLIVVRGYQSLGKNDLTLLSEYTAAPATFSVMVLISDGSLKSRATPPKGVRVIDLDKGSTVEQEIKGLAQKLGMTLAPGSAGFIKMMLGEDMNLIRNELEKMSLYSDGKKAIGERELRTFMEKHSTENTFSLSTALSNRDLKTSLRVLRELELNREDPLSILYMIAWRFRQIFKVSQCLKEGLSDESVAKVIKTSRGAVYYLKKSVLNFRENELGRILEILEKTDYGIKNSSGEGYILLEKLLLGICSGKN
ncbi:MAG: DNA polymerase III subunit delta [Candidatus Dadabacteria bacterium]|nr:DNA polymerase III subunit delta [Candidatus Dadabacteria bacterium]